MPCMGWFGRGSQDLPCQICDGGTQDASVSWQGLWYATVPCHRTVGYQQPMVDTVVCQSPMPETVACQRIGLDTVVCQRPIGSDCGIQDAICKDNAK